MFDIEYDKDLDTVNIEVFERTGFDNSAVSAAKNRYAFPKVSQAVATA